MGLNYAESLANILYFAFIVVLLHAVFSKLGLELYLLQQLLLLAFGGAMLGIGLAVGLGGRDVVNGILAGYYVRQNMKTGDHVTVGTITGTVREVGPVSTILDVQEAGVTTQRIVPNTKMLHEAVR
jgi:small-conductance mechanosensitive channel